jgi:hypothetical protein
VGGAVRTRHGRPIPNETVDHPADLLRVDDCRLSERLWHRHVLHGPYVEETGKT